MRAFSGILAVEGEPTTDGRTIVPGALSWPRGEAVPLTLASSAEVVGWIDRIWRDGNVVRCSGGVSDDRADLDEFKGPPETPEAFGLGMAVEILRYSVDGDPLSLDAVTVIEDAAILTTAVVADPAFPQARATFE